MKLFFVLIFFLISLSSAISIGEFYQYNAYLGPFYLGEFSFEVKGTENIKEFETYHIHFKSNIRQVDKESHIYLRTGDFRPVKVVRHYFDRDFETEIYDPENNTGQVLHKNDQNIVKRTFQGAHELHTPLSLLLYLREKELIIGEKFKVETTDEILQVNISEITRIDSKQSYKVCFEPMGLTVFYLENNTQVIPEVRWRVFFHDVRIKLKQ